MTSCPARRFCSPVDFDAQLADWLAVVNTRAWRALRLGTGDQCRTRAQPQPSLPLGQMRRKAS